MAEGEIVRIVGRLKAHNDALAALTETAAGLARIRRRVAREATAMAQVSARAVRMSGDAANIPRHRKATTPARFCTGGSICPTQRAALSRSAGRCSATR